MQARRKLSDVDVGMHSPLSRSKQSLTVSPLSDFLLAPAAVIRHHSDHRWCQPQAWCPSSFAAGVSVIDLVVKKTATFANCCALGVRPRHERAQIRLTP